MPVTFGVKRCSRPSVTILARYHKFVSKIDSATNRSVTSVIRVRLVGVHTQSPLATGPRYAVRSLWRGSRSSKPTRKVEMSRVVISPRTPTTPM